MKAVLVSMLLPLIAFAKMPNPMPRAADLPAACPKFVGTFKCAAYDIRVRGTEPTWPQEVHEACDDETCGNGVTAEECRKGCSTAMHLARDLVCPRCAMSALTKEPAAPQFPNPDPDPVGKPAAPTLRGPTAATPAGSKTSSLSGSAAPPCSAADCLHEGTATQQGGEAAASARRKTFDDGYHDAGDNTASSITGAQRMIKQLQAVAAQSSSPEVKAHFSSDQRLVTQASQALGPSRSGTFTPDDAQSAFDSGVRQELTNAAVSANLTEDFKTESAKAQKLAEDFQALSADTSQRAANLASAPSEISAPAPSRSAAREPGSGDVVGTAAIALSGARPAATRDPALSVLAPAAAASAHEGLGATAPAKEVQIHFNAAENSLRDRLRREMAAKQRVAEAVDAKAFGDGGLAPLPTGSERKPSSVVPGVVESAEDVLSTAFRGMGGRKGFGLGSAAETEAELRRLTQEQESVPGPESASLFERVRRVHRSCQQRTCVSSTGA